MHRERDHLPVVGPDDGTSQLRVLTQERAAMLADTTRLRNQRHAQLLQLDPQYRQTFPALTHDGTLEQLRVQVAALASADPLSQVRAGSVRRLVDRLLLLSVQTAELTAAIETLAKQVAAPLQELCGVGDGGHVGRVPGTRAAL